MGGEEQFDEYFKLDEEEPRRKKGLIIGAIVAVAAVCLICFCCSNTFKRTFYKPADYYKYVEKKNAKEKINLVTDWYDTGNLLIPGGGSIGYEDNLSVKMSEDILGDATEALDVYGIVDSRQDLSWLKDIKITGKTTMYDDLGSRNTAISIGSDTVLTLNTIADQKTGRMYLRIPELSDRYLGLDQEKLEQFSEIAKNYTDAYIPVKSDLPDYMAVAKALPEAVKINRIMTKYSDIFFDNMNNVEKSGRQKLEIGGVSQKCYCLTVVTDYKDMQNLAKQLRQEMSEDKDIRTAYVNMMNAEGENGEEKWNDLVDGLYVLEDILGGLSGSEMKVYVDTCGHIIAREITPADYDMTIRYGRTIDGREFGAQFVVNAEDDDLVVLRGNGKKAGQNYAGDFKLSIDESDPVEISLDSFNYSAFKKQRIDAQVSAGLEDIADSLDMEGYGADFLGDYKAIVYMDSQGSGAYNTKITLSDDVSEPVVIDYSYKKTGGSRITVPEDALMVEGFGDLKTYIKEADFTRVRNNLENAGVPAGITGYISYIEKAADYLDYIDLFL